MTATLLRLQRVQAVVGGRLRAAEPLHMKFDAQDPAAAAWAKEKAAALVKDLDEETLAALRSFLSSTFTEGIAPARAARVIRQMVGLNGRQADAVAALRKAIAENPGRKVWAGKVAVRVPEEGASQAFIDKAAAKYADRLISQRALTIARTETIAASNEGQRQLWMQAIGKGLLRGDEQREWMTTEGACPICKNLNKQRVGLNEPFDSIAGPIMAPPAHPNCRCGQALSGTRRQEVAA